MKIAQILALSSSSTVAADFLKHFQNNVDESLGRFVELLFHAGGWAEYEFTPQDFPPSRSFLIVKDLGPLSLTPPILEHTNFHTAFLEFLDCIFSNNDKRLLYNEKFMTSIIETICLLFKGSADAFKYVALLTGAKVMYVLTKEFEITKKQQSNPFEKNISDATSGLYRTCHLASTLIASKLQKYDGYFKGGYSKKREDCLIFKVVWPSVNLNFTLVNDGLVSDTSNCLKDESTDARDTGYMILKLILSQPAMDKAYKQNFFQYFKSDVRFTLKNDFKRAEWALIIIGSAVHCGDALSKDDIHNILFYVYDRNQAVAKLSARIIHQNFISVDAEPYWFLVELIRLNKLSFVSSEDLLVDAFYEILIRTVRWIDWDKLITGEDDSVADSLLLFQAFVRKATTDIVPQLRNERLVKRLSEEQISLNRSSFSADFPPFFFKYLEMKNIKDDATALSVLLKLIQYLNHTATTNMKALVDMAKVCLDYLKLNTVSSSKSSVAEEACRSLAHLTTLSLESGRGVASMLSITQAADSLANNSFFGWNDAVFLSLVKYLKTHNEFIWNVAFSQLRRANLVNDECSDFGEGYIITLITLLFGLLYRDARALSKEVTTSSSNGLVNLCKLRLGTYTFLLTRLLQTSSNFNVKKTCFVALLDSVDIFGRQLCCQGRTTWRSGNLSANEYDLVFRFVAESLQSRSNCRINWSRHCKFNKCCLALTKICDFICKGIVDVSCLALVMKKLIPNSVHEAIFTKTLDKYCLYFPLNWELAANALFNGVVSLIDEVISSETNRSEKGLAELWLTLSHLSKNVLAPWSWSEPRAMRAAAVKVHQHVIDASLRPGTQTSLPLLFILEPLIDLLSADCIPIVIAYLDQYGSTGASQVQEYKRLLMSTFTKIQSS